MKRRSGCATKRATATRPSTTRRAVPLAGGCTRTICASRHAVPPAPRNVSGEQGSALHGDVRILGARPWCLTHNERLDCGSSRRQEGRPCLSDWQFHARFSFSFRLRHTGRAPARELRHPVRRDRRRASRSPRRARKVHRRRALTLHRAAKMRLRRLYGRWRIRRRLRDGELRRRRAPGGGRVRQE